MDEEASVIENETVYLWSEAYSKKYKDYFRIDFRISYRMNSKRIDQEWAVDIQNITNHKNVFQYTWDPNRNEYRIDYQQGIFPMFLFRIYF